MEEAKQPPEGYAHWWSGWPGAFCMKCGAQDPAEIHLADGDMDYATGQLIFKDEHERAAYEAALSCPVKDDPEKHSWLNF